MLPKMNSPNSKLFCSITTISFSGVLYKTTRFFKSRPKPKRIDWKKLRPRIIERVNNRAKEYPLKAFIPVAKEVLKAHTILHQGVSVLLQHIPIWTCKWCPEVYVGEDGHLIRTCNGFQRRVKNHPHNWIKGSLEDVLIPVETFKLPDMSHTVVHHKERFDYDRISAVVELSLQAGAQPSHTSVNSNDADIETVEAASFPGRDLQVIATETLQAWETVRSGVERLLFAYPAKVCKHCSEVHVGVSGHKARLCGVFKFESWRGKHHWGTASVDDLVPPKIVWFRRPQDPPLLADDRRIFYGHAPAVVDVCYKAGATVLPKYHSMMKMNSTTLNNLDENQTPVFS